MIYDYDLIVVGGGPAGSTLALYAARQGLEVLLLEKERFPRDKVCGDALPIPCLRLLKELGLLAAVKELPQGRARMVFFTETERLALPAAPGGSPVIRRLLLDDLLFRAAGRQVETREGFRVQRLLFRDGRCCGVQGVDGGGTPCEKTAKVVAGADGCASVVAHQAGLRPPSARRGAVATRAYLRHLPMSSRDFELHYLEACRPGYFWIFPVDQGMANVGVLLFGRSREERGGSAKTLHRQLVRSPRLAPRFSSAEEVGPLRCWYLPMAGSRLTLHGDGVLLTGDAAGLVDPCLGHGIDTAMLSAKLAAEVLGPVCRGDDYSARALEPYAAAVRQQLGPGLAAGEHLRANLSLEGKHQERRGRMDLLNQYYFKGAGVRSLLSPSSARQES